jgi:protein gp37
MPLQDDQKISEPTGCSGKRHVKGRRHQSVRFASNRLLQSAPSNPLLTVKLLLTVIDEERHRQRDVETVMAETQIEWTDATWNPVAGCSIVSAGCTNCYAMEMARRLQAMNVPKYKGVTRRSGKRTIWNGVVREDAAALDIPLGWMKPKKIFVNSMSDLFHDRVTDSFILKVWSVMRATPRHHYQILTKRPERMGALVRSKIGEVLPNVWLGASVENADVVGRIDHLRAVPAAIRFISFEPLIGSVGALDLRDIHWAIVGGESGRSARLIREEWIDEIFDRCAMHNTVFFFKQWGTWGKDNKRRSKKANGRVYRDKVWDEMPTGSPSF